ncbi:glycosyltransferase [Pelagibacterium montanilacus]|uniref:glycosyltransferase n=1 Tax=Pelagibacterium montanilacus TaxID=2185280 RepID=UPI000F8DC3B1|nr:glycosyltransferase [Pelagibacterium montanilacus]
MKIMFVARAMNEVAGGLQRMLVYVMNALVVRGHSISLLSWDAEEARAFYPMADDVRWHKLAIGDAARKGSKAEIAKRIAKARQIIGDEQPELIVCFQGGPFRAMLLYTLGMGIPLVAAERTAPTLYEHANSQRQKRIEHTLFRFARRIFVQFDRYRTLYPANLHEKIVEIPNPVDPAQSLARPDVSGANGRFTLLSVGRLSYQKNQEALLAAFARIAADFPDWDVKLLGEGGDRSKLEALVAREPSLVGRVFLPGATTSINAEYAAAHLTCLPARWEGFPNALSEALAHGLPSVGYADCAGTNDLIVDGENGLLAAGNGDVDSLAQALASLMGDGPRRVAMGRAAVVSVARYRPEAIYDLWEKELAACLGR